MPRVEISEQEYKALQGKDNFTIMDFVQSKMRMEDFIRGAERERILAEHGKYYACWNSSNYRLD